MKNVIFLILALALFSCKKDGVSTYVPPASKPDHYTVIPKYSFKAHTNVNIEKTRYNGDFINMKYFGSGDAYDSTNGWFSFGRYTAKDTVKVHVKFHAWVISDYDVEIYWIGKTSKGVTKDIVQKFGTNQRGFTGIREMEVWEEVLYPGDYIEANLHMASEGKVIIYSTGANFGVPTDYSYFLIEAYE